MAQAPELVGPELRLIAWSVLMVCVSGWLQLALSLAVLTVRSSVQLCPAKAPPPHGLVERPELSVPTGGIAQ